MSFRWFGQIMQRHGEAIWRDYSDLVLAPDLKDIEWNGFEAGPDIVNAGEAAAIAALPVIRSWFQSSAVGAASSSEEAHQQQILPGGELRS
jgi:hypothetical protein